MTATLTPDLTQRIAKAFAGVFKNRIVFRLDLERISESKWDSLKHVELLVALEKEFKVRFDGADATDMSSVAKIIETVERKLA